MQTIFLIQATFMRLEFSSFTVPAASLSTFDVIAVLVFIPIMDHIVYPLLQRFGIRLTPLRRIGVGMLLAAASVVVAGGVEIKRRRVWEQGHFYDQIVFGEQRNASSLNIFWQVPQFMLIGASEVLCVITGTSSNSCNYMLIAPLAGKLERLIIYIHYRVLIIKQDSGYKLPAIYLDIFSRGRVVTI